MGTYGPVWRHWCSGISASDAPDQPSPAPGLGKYTDTPHQGGIKDRESSTQLQLTIDSAQDNTKMKVQRIK